MFWSISLLFRRNLPLSINEENINKDDDKMTGKNGQTVDQIFDRATVWQLKIAGV